MDPSGRIDTIAGTGSARHGSDVSAGRGALLDHPTGVAVAADGTVYIADTLNHRVRAVTTGGTITTVSGTGVFGTKPRLGPATSAQLTEPLGVAVTSSGSDLYIVGSDQALLWVTDLAL